MNIAQAKQIALDVLLQRLQAVEDLHKSKADRSELWYISPLRPEEKTASFKIDTRKNLWFDHGTGQGGDIIDLVREYLGGKTVRDALQWLRETEGGIPTQKPRQRIQTPKSGQETAKGEAEGFRLVKEKRLTNGALLAYIGQRGLPVDLVRQFCSEVYYKGQGSRNLFGIGMQNDAGGWEVRAAVGNLKSAIGEKDVTTRYGDKELRRLHVFEGMFDFLTKQHINPLGDDEAAMILNSSSMAVAGIAKIKQEPRLQAVSEVLLWMQNDATGERCLHEIALALEGTHNTGDMGHLYQGYKDLNEFWTNSPEARKLTQGEGLRVFHDSAWNQIRKPGPPRFG